MTTRVLVMGPNGKDARPLLDALKRESAFMARLFGVEEATLGNILKFKPEIIILVPAGGFDGVLPVFKLLKSENAVSEIPVVLVLGEDEFRREGIPTGIEDVFCRPLRVQECIARLTSLYKRFHRITDKNVIRTRELEMDVSRYEVRVSDRKVDLTYTEYELLKFMMSHPDQVFTRDVLLNKVWGYEYFGGARTVDVHVRRLRSKIEIKSLKFIETVRNIGYKFIGDDSHES